MLLSFVLHSTKTFISFLCVFVFRLFVFIHYFTLPLSLTHLQLHTQTLIHAHRPSPKLKDAVFNESKARELYLECIHIMRTIYHQCRLVHGDFSEYNILYVVMCFLALLCLFRPMI